MLNNIFHHKKEEKFERCSEYARMSPHYSFFENEPEILEEPISDNNFLSIEEFEDV